MTTQDLKQRFAPMGLTNDGAVLAAGLFEIALEINNQLADSREKSVAITHLENAMLWADRGLALHGSRNAGRGEDQPGDTPAP